MCLYPKLIKNPKYKPNKKNGGKPPKPTDIRLTMVPIGCGNCIECRKQLANNWRVRLSVTLSAMKIPAYYITLTFSEEKLNWYKLTCNNDNDIARAAIRHFLERWRKKYKKSVKHWLITELGHEGTERIHLHGIIWTEHPKEAIEERWGNGWVRIGAYVNLRTINYIIKYVTKIDSDHENYTGKIFCSAGLGKEYIEYGKNYNHYQGKNTKEYYRTKEGYKLALPMYYRNKIYSEEEREKLWIQKLDNGKRYCLGSEYNYITKEDKKNFMKVLETAQKTNIRNGYGGCKWKKEEYEKSIKKFRSKEY